MKLTKTTIITGHYATGDFECFCFDTHAGPKEHSAEFHAWLETDRSTEPSGLDDACRVYPNELMPDGVERRKGRWTITVEFEPEEP